MHKWFYGSLQFSIKRPYIQNQTYHLNMTMESKNWAVTSITFMTNSIIQTMLYLAQIYLGCCYSVWFRNDIDVVNIFMYCVNCNIFPFTQWHTRKAETWSRTRWIVKCFKFGNLGELNVLEISLAYLLNRRQKYRFQTVHKLTFASALWKSSFVAFFF